MNKLEKLLSSIYPNGIKFEVQWRESGVYQSAGVYRFSCLECKRLGIPWSFEVVEMDLNMAVEWECYFRDKLRNHALQHNALFQRLASVINPVPLVETQDDYEVRVLGNEWTVEKKKATNRRLIRL